MNNEPLSSSFRDPSGFLFQKHGKLYRQINSVYKGDYDMLVSSGLYKTLTDAKLLIPHKEIFFRPTPGTYKIIKPELIPFISYPYEWCFSQLKDAASVTLKIQKIALDFGMILKDCSAYNIQFNNGKPMLIDTLSFEKYEEGKPWIAYRQFCQHFLAPLALMVYRDVRLNQLFRIYIDGIPLDLTSSLLPLHTRFKFTLLSHIHIHYKSQKYFAKRTSNASWSKVSRLGLRALVDSLESTVMNLKWKPRKTEWRDYYKETNYSQGSFEHKKRLVNKFLNEVNSSVVWDLGANTGLFSRIASKKGIPIISFDIDPAVVEKNYLDNRKRGETRNLSLTIDLTNPSPSLGWINEERMSLLQRGPADVVMALALIHHLAISNNLPFGKIAEFFNKICHFLIIEFVPKSDSQVKRILSTRKDIFPDYTQKSFEYEFKKFFKIREVVSIRNSQRILYFMKRKTN